MNKCPGCGAVLPAFFDKPLCEKCFKLKHYGVHENTDKTLSNEQIIAKVNNSQNVSFFLCDLMMLSDASIALFNKIQGNKLLVLTKMDVIPKNVSLTTLKKNIQKVYHLDDILMVSIKSATGLKKLEELLEQYKVVNFVGPTSSGKSSLINYLTKSELTVSAYVNTTKDLLNVQTKAYEIIDYPGFTFKGFTEASKKAGFLRPKVLFLKKDYLLAIEDIKLYSDKDMNLTIFIPKNISYKTYKNRGDSFVKTKINKESELCILGKGIIYFKKTCNLYINDISNVDVRESILVGHE